MLNGTGNSGLFTSWCGIRGIGFYSSGTRNCPNRLEKTRLMPPPTAKGASAAQPECFVRIVQYPNLPRSFYFVNFCCCSTTTKIAYGSSKELLHPPTYPPAPSQCQAKLSGRGQHGLVDIDQVVGVRSI